jgi:hypothetical protein
MSADRKPPALEPRDLNNADPAPTWWAPDRFRWLSDAVQHVQPVDP